MTSVGPATTAKSGRAAEKHNSAGLKNRLSAPKRTALPDVKISVTRYGD